MRFVNLEGADIRGANFYLAVTDFIRMKNVITDSGTYLRDEAMNAMHVLSGRKHLPENSSLIRTYLAGIDLSDAQMRGFEFSEANLSGAILRGANLRAADLSGTDLSGADLRDADLTGATYNAKTKWPSGFEPPETAEFYDKILSNVFAAHGSSQV
jgi:uncharacterized protein YjbI with pentapeptide repeats